MGSSRLAYVAGFLSFVCFIGYMVGAFSYWYDTKMVYEGNGTQCVFLSHMNNDYIAWNECSSGCASYPYTKTDYYNGTCVDGVDKAYLKTIKNSDARMAVMMTAFYLTFAGALSMASALLLNYIVTCSSDKLGNSLIPTGFGAMSILFAVAGMAVLIDQFPAARNKDLECTTTCNATVTTNCTTCPTTLFTSDNGVPYTIALGNGEYATVTKTTSSFPGVSLWFNIGSWILAIPMTIVSFLVSRAASRKPQVA